MNFHNKNNSETVIALIGPDFFSYIQAIRDEITLRGYKCYYYDERHSNTIFSKIAYRLKLKLLIGEQRDRHLKILINKILANKTTDVFLIDVEVIDPNFVNILKGFGIRIHIYMWDSSKNKRTFLGLLPFLDGKSSFEPSDCKKYNLTYIPLFAEKIFKSKACVNNRKNSLVFLGTLHSHRTKLLQNIENILKGTGIEVEKLLYYHSRLLFLVKSIINPTAIKYFFQMQTTAFTKFKISNTYFNARVVLDIHHPGQSGLTSRTFEALRAGCWLITSNETVTQLPDELRDRVIFIDNTEELKNKIFLVYEDLPPLSESADYFLSLERFVDDLMRIGGLNALNRNH
jgi:hypothetical protein